MIQLLNGCSCSPIKVIPKNWNSTNASLKKNWFIYYRFHDPNFKTEFPKGKLKIIKGGVNNLKTLGERRDAIRELLKVEKTLLEEQGYNPILNKKAIETHSDYIIAPSTGFAQSLRLAFERLEKQPSTISDIRSVIKVITNAATSLGMHCTPVSEIKRRHIISMLDWCQRMNENWSANRYNKCKAYLSVLFNELVRVESVEENPVMGIAKKKTVQNIRETLTLEERKKIDRFLKENNYRFWRFLQLFFHSGARETELMKVKKEDVNINEQYFIVTIFKRNMPERVKRPIKNVVQSLWKEIHDSAKNGEYLFGRGLIPGTVPISPSQISRRWRTHIKAKLGITADFYSLKHLNLDETAAILDIESAAQMAGHTSTVITMKHYALNEEKRKLEKLKSVNNNFGF